MFARKLIHIFMYGIALFTLINWGGQGFERVMNYINPPNPQSLAQTVPKAFTGSSLTFSEDFLNYNFAHVLELLDVAQKAKYLEYQAYLTGRTPLISTNTLIALSQDLYYEKSQFKSYVSHLRQFSKYPLSTRKMRGLLYYLKIVEMATRDIDRMIEKRKV